MLTKVTGMKNRTIVHDRMKYPIRKGVEIEIPEYKVDGWEEVGLIKRITKKSKPKQDDLLIDKHNIEEELLFKGKEDTK